MHTVLMTTAQQALPTSGAYTPKTAATTHVLYPCDICGMAVVAGERVVVEDNGLTIQHTACVRAWFRRNFGREYL